MRDPFPIPPPEALVQAIKPLATTLGLSTLPLHAHEVVFALALYTFVGTVLSPLLSNALAGSHYRQLNRRTKINWDVHVVSFFQSCIICGISLYIVFCDEERKEWRRAGQWEKRIWGYEGLTGLCQSFALGYFLWDLFMCTWRVDIFGWGMLAHAISAVSVFSFGYRPFLYFYAPVFLLYELSSPFLNIHWFCDKVNLTGSTIQAVNGALLTTTFFFCRIVWGLYSSYKVFSDVFGAVRAGHSERQTGILGEVGEVRKDWASGDVGLYYQPGEQETAFMGEKFVPLWLVTIYLASNAVLNLLNIWWFSKMIETIRSRFDPPFGTKCVRQVKHWEPEEKVKKDARELHEQGKGSVKAARIKAEEALNGEIQVQGEPKLQRGIYEDGHRSVEVSGMTTKGAGSAARKRRKA
ncbi:DUF887-domain-containing protein [Teratosphaeria nubilosa]|uniref:DUF887-domain-containing protein n=1 Tax=Teratosphaeria nubilosa TaxID=161662 RepID=A0A6G1L1Q2_9PEZI|nr:DUF887-domain-containing protein [Teratosphaeria nubilosa]